MKSLYCGVQEEGDIVFAEETSNLAAQWCYGINEINIR
jgi:hypothetical protein